MGKYGAVATGIYASDNSFGNYAKGVFDTCSSTKMNHAVTVVGYGTENGKPYWVVKNSWGANWGDGGYIKIARGNSECGIGSQCALVECSKTGTASPAPQAPPPAPIPASQICDISNLYGTSSITGQYTLTTTINGKQYVANVKCKIQNAVLQLLVQAMLACTFVARLNVKTNQLTMNRI